MSYTGHYKPGDYNNGRGRKIGDPTHEEMLQHSNEYYDMINTGCHDKGSDGCFFTVLVMFGILFLVGCGTGKIIKNKTNCSKQIVKTIDNKIGTNSTLSIQSFALSNQNQR